MQARQNLRADQSQTFEKRCRSKQTRKSPIPVPPIPDLAGKRGPTPWGGNSRFPIGRESGIGKRAVSRFGRETPGNRGPDWPQIGKSGIPCGVSTAGLDVALKVLQMQILASPHLRATFLLQLPSVHTRTGRWRIMMMTTRTRRWRTMGRTLRTMSTQSLSEFTAVDARTSLGNRESDPPFSRGLGGFPDSRFPIGRESGNGNLKRAVSRSAGNRESGSRFGEPGISWSGSKRIVLKYWGQPRATPLWFCVQNAIFGSKKPEGFFSEPSPDTESTRIM